MRNILVTIILVGLLAGCTGEPGTINSRTWSQEFVTGIKWYGSRNRPMTGAEIRRALEDEEQEQIKSTGDK